MKPVVDYIRKVCLPVMISNKSKTEITRVQELVYEPKIKDALTHDVITAEPDTLMSELREILRANRIFGAPVINGEKLVGIISVEDLVNWLAAGSPKFSVKDMMTENVQTLYSDEPLIHAVSKLEQTGFSSFPIIERQNDKLVGVITKSNIIERLLREMEIGYREEEIHHYRASHIFEDVIADEVALKFCSIVKGQDFHSAGTASSGVKKTLQRLGIHPHIIRRAAIASYEAEMNVVIYTNGGEMSVEVQPNIITIDITDSGPGMPDIEKAMEPGYSTATEKIRELGFGAGMGLVNIQKCSDMMDLQSTVGEGTHLRISFDLNGNQGEEKK